MGFDQFDFVSREFDQPVESQKPVGARTRRLPDVERLLRDVETFTRRWKAIYELETLARPDAPEEAAAVTPAIGQNFKKKSMDIAHYRTSRQLKMNREWERITAIGNTHA
jgi:hypothetical protein